MSILFDKGFFTINTKNSTYQMKVDHIGYLLHTYYGKKTAGCMDYLFTYEDRGFSGNPYDVDKNRTYSMDILPQEFPTKGSGDYRITAGVVRNADGSLALDLRYQGHEIVRGKYSLEKLPAVYATEEEAETLKIFLKDKVSGVEVTLLYGVLADIDIITRSVLVKNVGEAHVVLEKMQTACLDLMNGDYDVITFHGRHAMERLAQRQKVGHGIFQIGSKRGTSSHQYNPMMVIAEQGTSENYGNCYSMSFVYSGNFLAEVEQTQMNATRVLMGLQSEQFAYPLESGETFTGPEVILSFSSDGMNHLSQNLHKCIRKHICRGKYRDGERPVLVNSWEAAYFNFNGETIYQLAKEAKELGIDMVVMDDGWFGKRDDDFSGLGDWFVNEEKLGESLGHLVERINGLGVKFGIWFEPECINEDSDLYREHPEWVLAIPGRDPVRARYQLVLDFSNKKVVDEIFKRVCDVVDQANIEYIKWDFNRSLEDIFSQAGLDNGKVTYDYVLGLYDFLERLIQRYPNILIEGCSGGGGRFDAGMLYYTPQIWCSDNTDAIDRLKIQYGTSFGYPVTTMGSHVSAVPNHQTGRETPLHVRGTVAMSGTFGYELNLGRLSAQEKEAVKDQLATFHRYSALIREGLYYRLTDPFKDSVGAWAFVAEDGTEALVNIVVQDMHGNMIIPYVKIQGLLPGSLYKDEASGRVYPADALSQFGIPVPLEMGEYRAYQIHLVRMEA